MILADLERAIDRTKGDLAGLPVADTKVQIRDGNPCRVRNPRQPEVVASATVRSCTGETVEVELAGTGTLIWVPSGWLIE